MPNSGIEIAVHSNKKRPSLNDELGRVLALKIGRCRISQNVPYTDERHSRRRRRELFGREGKAVLDVRDVTKANPFPGRMYA
jgi:hypothetical protein